MLRIATIAALFGVLTIGFVGASYDAEADGGWLFKRLQQRRSERERCTPKGGIAKPAEVPFPIDELDVAPDPVTPCSIVEKPPYVPPLPLPVATRCDLSPSYLALVARMVALETMLRDLPLSKPQPAELPDISIIVGEVLKRLPPQVAYYEIVPRNSK